MAGFLFSSKRGRAEKFGRFHEYCEASRGKFFLPRTSDLIQILQNIERLPGAFIPAKILRPRQSPLN